ncbi:S41 family peptidase [Kitasatospora sp. NPDC017646]|uniref:S41 family peptidase n=1 Tax=Kitasatospora sp. NPDC017646 TaxID=3364024 RepID=UPI0037A14493
MRPRWAAAIVATLLLLGGAAASGPASEPEGARLSPQARAYLSDALDLLQRDSLNTARVDWKDVRAKAFSRADGARTPQDTYPAINGAVSALDDRHGRFVPPDRADRVLGDPEVVDSPTSNQLPGHIGYLTLRGVNGSDRTYAEYVARGRAAVAETDRAGACGWVVDLRGETGGGMWAPLAVAAPILGDGPLGGFVTAHGKRSAWSIRGGVPYLDDTPLADADALHPLAATPPVAVLTGRWTASAGEAVAVAFIGRPVTRSFGDRTYGVPTGNEPHRLSDGAVVVLTTAAEADRTGRILQGPLVPDETIDTPTTKNADPALDAAVNWLAGQGPCKGY